MESKPRPTMSAESRSAIIRNHPIGDELRPFLRVYDSLYGSFVDRWPEVINNLSLQDVKTLLQALILALQDSPVPSLLPSMLSGENLLSDLQTLHSAVARSAFDLDQVKDLLKVAMVAKNVDNNGLWEQLQSVVVTSANMRDSTAIIGADRARATISQGTSNTHQLSSTKDGKRVSDEPFQGHSSAMSPNKRPFNVQRTRSSANRYPSSGGPPVPVFAPSGKINSESRDIAENALLDSFGSTVEHGGAPTFEPLGLDAKTEHVPTNYEEASPASFRKHILEMNPFMQNENVYLVDRIVRQQVIRYKMLMNAKVNHVSTSSSCPSGSLCVALCDPVRLLAAKAIQTEKESQGSQASHDDDETTDTGMINNDSFPPGIPMPPAVVALPAEIECHLCFQRQHIQKPSDWTKHVHGDVQPFACTWRGCPNAKIFKRRADWIRHENEQHRHLEWWVCDIDGCRHTCYRRDNFIQHLVREHKLSEPKGKSRSKSGNEEDNDPTRKRAKQCHRQTSNPPKDEPCRFCGSSFPSFKKLTSHLAMHMEQISLSVLQVVEYNGRNMTADKVISPIGVIEEDVDGRTLFEPLLTASSESISQLMPLSYSPMARYLNPHPLDLEGPLFLPGSTVLQGVSSTSYIASTATSTGLQAAPASPFTSFSIPEATPSLCTSSKPSVESIYDSKSSSGGAQSLYTGPGHWGNQCIDLGLDFYSQIYEIDGSQLDQPHDFSSGEEQEQVGVLDRSEEIYSTRKRLITPGDSLISSARNARGARSARKANLNHVIGAPNPIDEATAAQTLARDEPKCIQDFKASILSSVGESRDFQVLKTVPHKKTMFLMEWDPLLFIKEQQYAGDAPEALERAITLTGSEDDAQALTTGEYLSQTWPQTGPHTMRWLKSMVENSWNNFRRCKLPNGAKLSGWRECATTHICVEGGTLALVVEIAHQLGWLGAALRTSTFETGVTNCWPYIIQPSPTIHIGFHLDVPHRHLSKPIAGQCWHKMFRNPVLVLGYPTKTMSEPLGLEMPLNMMACMAGSDRVVEFGGNIFIKGFSTMLIATKLAHDILVWHYIYNKEGERLPYTGHEVEPFSSISLAELDSFRHVVGWSSDCKYYAGAADARYNIGGSNLPRPHAGCLLEKVSLSSGKGITGGVTFVPGVRDMPPHLTRQGYIPKLKWIATKHVVLWDEEDKRGWLVNGISALLHLVRASLEHYRTDDFSSSFLFEEEKMHNACDRKPKSAISVLTNAKNRELVIYPGKLERSDEEETQEGSGFTSKKSKKVDYFLFDDLVEQHLRALEQIMDHHAHLAGRNGINVRLRLRKQLEGWDFAELATDHDPSPRVATLHALGYGWVDFVRSIEAVTLFGRGFGDIIRPAEFDGMCSRWKSLPKQKYYLAASMYDLNNIMLRFGDTTTKPPKLVQDLVWHSPEDLMTACYCRGLTLDPRAKVSKSHYDPVQVLCPAGLRMKLKQPRGLGEHGAVVFGHSLSWGYRWRERDGDAEPGEDPGILTGTPPQVIPMRSSPRVESSSERGGLSHGSPTSTHRDSTTDQSLAVFSQASERSTPIESIPESPEAVSTIESQYSGDGRRPFLQSLRDICRGSARDDEAEPPRKKLKKREGPE